MRITLIGMSGIGKSHWSEKLAETGYERICCDDLISAKLAAELGQATSTVFEMGEWMGFPYEPTYEERAAKYLSYEIEVLTEIVQKFASGQMPANVVIDVTGSVIYVGQELFARLRRYTTVVHLSTTPDIHQQMLQAYLANPRPVLWQGLFQIEPGETHTQTFERCYPRFLLFREKLYRQYSDVILDYYFHHRENLTPHEFLQAIRQA